MNKKNINPEDLSPTEQHILAVMVSIGATTSAHYIHGQVPEHRYLEVEEAQFKMEEAFLGTKYAKKAQHTRMEFIREQMGATLASVTDINEAKENEDG